MTTSAFDPGPRCARCGCSAAEHEREVSASWELVPGRCLTCSDCPGFLLQAPAQKEPPRAV